MMQASDVDERVPQRIFRLVSSQASIGEEAEHLLSHPLIERLYAGVHCLASATNERYGFFFRHGVE